MRRALSALVLGFLVACGGSNNPTGPDGPPQQPPPPPPPTDNWVITGKVVSYGTGTPISGARLTPGAGSNVTTDANGEFRLSSTTVPSAQPIELKVEADGHITRELHLRYQAGQRGGVTVDLIRNAAPFSLGFYKALVRDEYDDPDNLAPVLRLEESPKFYVRTIDQHGKAIESEVLGLVQSSIRKAVTDWTNGKLSVTTLETGRETRPRTDGWIVVNIIRDSSVDYCGRAYVGAEDGQIEFVNDLNGCRCGSTKISGAVVSHEVGHAMGFFHVGDRASVMFPYVPGRCPAGNLSANERYHSALAYTRTRGNLDVDRDAPWGAMVSAPGASGTDIEIVN